MDATELMRIAGHCAKVYGRRVGLQRDDLADVRQDVLLKLLSAMRGHQPERLALRPFLFVIGKREAKRLVAKLVDRRRRERQLVAGHLRPVRSRPRLDDVEEVAHMMRGLTDAQRAAIEGCVLGDQSRQEYAARRGRGRGVAGEAIKRAIKNMRRKAALTERDVDAAA